MEQIIILIVLLLSIVIHELSHGYMAYWLGDPTAKLQGRLTMNPLVHIDPLGSIIIPAVLFFTGSDLLFGWAKPVPYNPYNLSDQRHGEAKVAAAGPISNIVIAIIFGTLIRFHEILGLNEAFVSIAGYAVFINIMLAFFNSIPIPPLDGSKILTALLPFRLEAKYKNFIRLAERFTFLVLILIIFVVVPIVWPPLFTAVSYVGAAFTGLSPVQFIGLLG